MKHIIKVNGYTIDATKVAMLDRMTRRFFSDAKHDMDSETGVLVRFDAGGVKWIADPEAKAVEQAFMAYDGVQERPELPYLA